MKRFVPLIADAVLAAVCAFLLFFTLVRFYFSTAAGLAAGIIGGLAAGAGAFAYIAAKQSRSASLSAGKREAEKLAVHLACIPQSEAEELFMRCLDGAEQKDGRIECEGEAYFTKFCMEPCDRDDLLPAARFKTDKKKVLCMQRRNGRMRRIRRRLRRGNNLCGRRIRTFEGARRTARKVYGRG